MSQEPRKRRRRRTREKRKVVRERSSRHSLHTKRNS